MQHSSCREAVHAAHADCSLSSNKEEYYKAQNISKNAGDCACARPPVRCNIAGTSAPVYACLKGAQEEPQTVYGLPLHGGGIEKHIHSK